MKYAQKLWESQTIKLVTVLLGREIQILPQETNLVSRLARLDYIPYIFNMYLKKGDIHQKTLAKKTEKNLRVRHISRATGTEPKSVANGWYFPHYLYNEVGILGFHSLLSLNMPAHQLPLNTKFSKMICDCDLIFSHRSVRNSVLFLTVN